MAKVQNAVMLLSVDMLIQSSKYRKTRLPFRLFYFYFIVLDTFQLVSENEEDLTLNVTLCSKMRLAFISCHSLIQIGTEVHRVATVRN